MARSELAALLDLLAECYGEPKTAPVKDPLDLILWENILYLAEDDQRARALEALRTSIGLHPADILSASNQDLIAVTSSAGILPQIQAQKLRTIARIARDEFGGDLCSILKLPVREARNALKRFPAIGGPGAEKILLFTHTEPVLALESNGLRVLTRLGYGKQAGSYSATYRSVAGAAAPLLPKDCRALIRAYSLLREHGKKLCLRTRPWCHECPLSRECPSSSA